MYIHGDFHNEKGDHIEVHMLTHGNRSKELEIGDGKSGLWFGDDPVDMESEMSDTFDVLLCQQVTVRLLTANYVEEFFCANVRDAVVNIYREGELLFAGYIEPQAYSQGYNEALDEIELSCIDVLTAMQYAKYRNVGTAQGVAYAEARRKAGMRSMLDVMKEMLDGALSGLDILGGNDVRYWYDGSKALDSTAYNHYAIFGQLSVNELLFLGDEEDDVWQQDAVLEELLRYLDLHIVQQGLDFYIFDWSTKKKAETVTWHDIAAGTEKTVEITTTAITTQNVADTDAKVSVGETYSQIALTCETKSMEDVVRSPLDDDLLEKAFSGWQLYMTEYDAGGDGFSHRLDLYNITHGYAAAATTNTGDWRVADWYVQVLRNPEWTFPSHGTGDLYATYCAENKHQEGLPDVLSTQIGAGLLSFGKAEMTGEKSRTDNSPTEKVSMTNYLVVGVNGNGEDEEAKAYPNEEALKAAIPVAVYTGKAAGGAFMPSDDETTNYIVLSGRVILNPRLELTTSYKSLNGKKTPDEYLDMTFDGDGAVEMRDGKSYYTQQIWKAETPRSNPAWDENIIRGLQPFTDKGRQMYEFKYSAIGDSVDHISKISVLQCMLIIGGKCVVETGSNGNITDFEWHDYKPLSECADEDEYYAQSFSIGFDPKIGDKLIGTQFDLQNNISYKLGIDAEGTAIPIKKSDKVSGEVKFMILGPVNTLWDVVTRRHPTMFRHTKWRSTSVPLLAHVSDILLESFEIKVYSDNGLVNNTDDSDLVYMSDTDKTYVNKKDDITFKLSSALTTGERQELGISDSVKMSTPVVASSGAGVLSIYDRAKDVQAKPEKLYVDSYYTEYSTPRRELTVKLADKAGGLVSAFGRYRHTAMGKTFFVEGISRNIEEGYAEMKLKEIN